MSSLQVQNLSKQYVSEGKAVTTALDNIGFHVQEGEFVSILGPSGCGKTTLLRTIAGLEQATRGAVLVDGNAVKKPGPERGVVFQEHRLFPWLSVQDNVTYGLARQGISKKERRKRSQHYLEMVGLSDFAGHFPKELSIGMSQRVGIARALATDPDILLMDEPFASVDAQTRRELHRELLTIWQETHKTIIFVTHDITEAVLLSTRIIVLSARPGRIQRSFDVDLDYPRKDTDADFNAIKEDIMGLMLQ
ncbi:MAG: ABC transporter ATP-binding protein [Chloroflexota bacterium]